jgi:hypothetical protein
LRAEGRLQPFQLGEMIKTALRTEVGKVCVIDRVHRIACKSFGLLPGDKPSSFALLAILHIVVVLGMGYR